MMTDQTTLEAVIARRQVIRAAIDEEDDEDRVAKLCDNEDRLLLKLARRREPSDDAFFDKIGYLLTSRTAEFGEPTMQDPLGVVAIAVRHHLERRAAAA